MCKLESNLGVNRNIKERKNKKWIVDCTFEHSELFCLLLIRMVLHSFQFTCLTFHSFQFTFLFGLSKKESYWKIKWWFCVILDFPNTTKFCYQELRKTFQTITKWPDTPEARSKRLRRIAIAALQCWYPTPAALKSVNFVIQKKSPLYIYLTTGNASPLLGIIAFFTVHCPVSLGSSWSVYYSRLKLQIVGNNLYRLYFKI